jgi:hypothetical protein
MDFYEQEVNKILEGSSRIKKMGLNRSLLLICVMHMRVESEEEAQFIANKLPYNLSREPYGLSVSALEADPTEMSKDLMRYWRYCKRLGYI